MRKCPCYGCVPPKRQTGKINCHSVCDEYIEWKAEITAFNQEIVKQNTLEHNLNCSKYERCRVRKQR